MIDSSLVDRIEQKINDLSGEFGYIDTYTGQTHDDDPFTWYLCFYFDAVECPSTMSGLVAFVEELREETEKGIHSMDQFFYMLSVIATYIAQGDLIIREDGSHVLRVMRNEFFLTYKSEHVFYDWIKRYPSYPAENSFLEIYSIEDGITKAKRKLWESRRYIKDLRITTNGRSLILSITGIPGDTDVEKVLEELEFWVQEEYDEFSDWYMDQFIIEFLNEWQKETWGTEYEPVFRGTK